MNAKTRKYVEDILHNLLRNGLKEEFEYLKLKYKYYHEGNHQEILNIINQQVAKLTKDVKHLNSYNYHIKLISMEVFGDEKLNREQTQRFKDILFREGDLFHFIIKHVTEYFQNLKNEQVALLNEDNWINGNKIQKARLWFNEKRHHTYLDFLKLEEKFFNEVLNLFLQRTQSLQLQIKLIEENKAREKIIQYVKTGAITITAVPLGPLEVLSVPFWGAYLSLEYLSKFRKDFKEWQRIEKNRIIL